MNELCKAQFVSSFHSCIKITICLYSCLLLSFFILTFLVGYLVVLMSYTKRNYLSLSLIETCGQLVFFFVSKKLMS